jgi:hypothetical protein
MEYFGEELSTRPHGFNSERRTMGVSTDAVFFYGYCWSEEEELIEEDEWPEVVAKNRGLRDPWLDCPQVASREEVDQWVKQHRAEIDAWNDAKNAIGEEFGCDIGGHCSEQTTMPYVFIQGSEKLASRGYPERFDPDEMHADDAWNDRLNRFLKELGIRPPKKQKPGWWLVSYWG